MTGVNLFPEGVGCSTRVLFVNLGEAEQAASLGLLRTLRDAGIAPRFTPRLPR